MPVQIEELSSEITVMDGEMPLSAAQIEKLVKLVMSRLDEHKRSLAQRREATRLRPDSTRAPEDVGHGCE